MSNFLKKQESSTTYKISVRQLKQMFAEQLHIADESTITIIDEQKTISHGYDDRYDTKEFVGLTVTVHEKGEK